MGTEKLYSRAALFDVFRRKNTAVQPAPEAQAETGTSFLDKPLTRRAVNAGIGMAVAYGILKKLGLGTTEAQAAPLQERTLNEAGGTVVYESLDGIEPTIISFPSAHGKAFVVVDPRSISYDGKDFKKEHPNFRFKAFGAMLAYGKVMPLLIEGEGNPEKTVIKLAKIVKGRDWDNLPVESSNVQDLNRGVQGAMVYERNVHRPDTDSTLNMKYFAGMYDIEKGVAIYREKHCAVRSNFDGNKCTTTIRMEHSAFPKGVHTARISFSMADAKIDVDRMIGEVLKDLPIDKSLDFDQRRNVAATIVSTMICVGRPLREEYGKHLIALGNASKTLFNVLREPDNQQLLVFKNETDGKVYSKVWDFKPGPISCLGKALDSLPRLQPAATAPGAKTPTPYQQQPSTTAPGQPHPDRVWKPKSGPAGAKPL